MGITSRWKKRSKMVDLEFGGEGGKSLTVTGSKKEKMDVNRV